MKYICDKCGQVIESVEDGYVEWLEDNVTGEIFGFKIVHHVSARKGCYYDEDKQSAQGRRVNDHHLETFTGDDGLIRLLSLIETGRARDITEITDIIKRIHTPNYEQARPFMDEAKEDGLLDDADEVVPYLQITLREIIRRYS